MSYPRLPTFRGFFDPPTLWQILTLIVTISPMLWAKRQQILGFIKRNDGFVAGMASVVIMLAVLTSVGQTFPQIFSRYELYPTFALPATAIASRRVAIYRLRKRAKVKE